MGIYLCTTSRKPVSTVKLHRDLRISLSSAWSMLRRIREVWAVEGEGQAAGPVEVDETCLKASAEA